MENIREIALDTLLEMEKGSSYSHQVITAVMNKYDYLDGHSKAFYKRLVEGTTERRLELDYLLDQYSGIPVRKMKPLIRCLMRMSLYQILYMDNVPDAAACNEGVKLAARRNFHNLKGFVNGVLRNMARNKDALAYPDPIKEPGLYLSVKYSMPEWLISLWQDAYGREITVKLLEGLQQIQPVSIRFTKAYTGNNMEKYLERIRETGAKTERSSYLDYAAWVSDLAGVTALPGYYEGAFTVQDISSMLCVEAAGLGKDSRVLDVCAAPGGKSLFACERAVTVTAGDISAGRLERLKESAERLKVHNITTRQWDATVFDEDSRESADVLFLDVPCSGLGVIGKKSDIKYNVSESGMEEIIKRQKEIIGCCYRYVKKGGILIYSTCTINPGENEEIFRWILQELPFSPDGMEAFIPAVLWKQKQCLKETGFGGGMSEAEWNACFQCLPGLMRTDGFFIARMKRTG